MQGAKAEPLGQRVEVESGIWRLEAETEDHHAYTELVTERPKADPCNRVEQTEDEPREWQEPVEMRNKQILEEAVIKGGWVRMLEMQEILSWVEPGVMLLACSPGQMHLETQAYWLSCFLLCWLVCFSGLSVCGGLRQSLRAVG